MKIVLFILGLMLFSTGCSSIPQNKEQRKLYKEHKTILVKFLRKEALEKLDEGGIAFSYTDADGEIQTDLVSGSVFVGLANLLNNDYRDALGLCAVYSPESVAAKPSLWACNEKIVEMEEIISLRQFMSQFIELNAANRSAIFDAQTAIHLLSVDVEAAQSHLKAIENQQAQFNTDYKKSLVELIGKLEEISERIP
jgi:hypothetical protein